MRIKKYSVFIIFVTIFTALIVLLTAGSIPPSSVTQNNSRSDARDALVERDEAHVDNGELISPTIPPVVSQVTPSQDGLSIIESRCTQCHVAQQLKQIKKPRSEWEKTLAQMEMMGVHLSDSERGALFNYLAVADKP